MIATDFQSIALYGTVGIQFKARLETEQGDLQVSYMVRPQDLADLEESEYGAWLSPYELEDPPKEKMRPNPIRQVARKHLEN